MLKLKKIAYKWELVILLWLALFFNQADRQVFNVVLPAIRDDLGLTDANMGLIATVLLLVCGLLVPVAGIAGDRCNKKNIILVSLLVWSGATLVTGMSCSLWHLILLRSVATGGGEAFYFPAASALIGESHEKTRATALSIHQTAVYVGIICSGYLAGMIADAYGWRMAFYTFGGFGIILAFVLYNRLRDSVVQKKDGAGLVPRAGVKDLAVAIFKKPSFILLALAFAGMNFAGVGFLVWMPTFLHEKYGFTLSRAGFDATFYHHIAAFVGVLAAARITDFLTYKMKRIRVIVSMLVCSRARHLSVSWAKAVLCRFSMSRWCCSAFSAGFMNPTSGRPFTTSSTSGIGLRLRVLCWRSGLSSERWPLTSSVF